MTRRSREGARGAIAAGALVACLMIAVGTAGAAVPVIPGAVGFGIETSAGRGGRILRVTNLNDSGAGSLRAALEASGPRIVVFDVSGTIVLSSQIIITNPFVTIAGQTAPSPGITVRGNYVGPRAHDILMQHIRVRTGYGPNVDANTGAIQLYNPGSNPVYNVVIDHCSASWAINENLTTWGTSGDRVHDVTFRYTISSEGLACTPISDEGCHSKGLLIGDGNRNIAVLDTIFAHDADRLPELKGGAQAVLANNIMYNWDPAQQATHMGYESYFAEPTLLSVLGNAYIQGPNMNGATAYAIEASSKIPAGSKVHYNDNRLDFGTKFTGRIDLFRNEAPYNPTVTTPPISVPGLAPLPSSQVEAHLLAQAGARPCDRDPVDTRVIDSVRNRTGKIINDQSEVGGWPTLAENRRPAGWDTDGDGMPDSWETGQGFDPASATDGNQDADGDGYTNVEEYLHAAAAEVECTGPPTPPPPPPAAPSGLAASALSSIQVRLTWTDQSNNETGFRVERCTGSGCTTYALVGTTGAGVTTYDDSGLQASTTYGYRVAATNGGGTSEYSNEASATTAAPPPPGAILFQDDFEDGVADGWTVSGGSWSVLTDGTKAYRQGSTSSDGISAAGDAGWTDYTVEVRARPVVFNSAGGFVRLMARYRDASNYYYLTLRSTQVLELKKMVGGSATTLATKSFGVAADSWYTLQLEVVGTGLKGYVNGTLQVSATDSQFNSGRIGVGTYNASGSFDDMFVRQPGGTPPPGDADLDGVQDGVDNCPTVANASQRDYESDGWGDMCDNCPTVANTTQQDSDSDGLGNACEDMRVNANVDDLRSSEARIDGSDYFDLARAFGTERGQTAFDPLVDLNRDRKVDGKDLALLTTVWGEALP